MAVDNKGGSDLDVFEGLGKKTAPRASHSPAAPPRSISNGPPPPPPSLRSGDNGAKSTLLGVNGPPGAFPPPPGAPPAVSFGPASQKSAPPPPPGRGALPPLGAPPSKSSPMFPAVSSPPSKPPQAVATPSAKPGAKLDMDWDDDEEATHVFDKDKDDQRTEAAPAPTPSTKLPTVGKPLPAPAKQTLLGIAGPPPPPPSLREPHAALPPPPQTLRPAGLVPPPPSSVGSAFARASSINASSPGPVPYNPPPPPDRPPPSLPPQQVTAPMAMPQRSAPPPAIPPPTAASTYRPTADSSPLSKPVPLPNRMEATALVRPQEQSRSVLMAGVAAGVVMVIAVLFYLWPHTGQIAVNVADAKGAAIPHLQISIDGKKQCESAPCIVSDVPTGPHTIKVEAAGYEATVDKAVAVESKKDVTVDFTLTPTAAAATGIKVTGTQAGAKLYIDDKEVGSLPQEIKDLSPGSHKVKVFAGDRFTAAERTVTVNKDEMQDLGLVTLKVVKGKATISLGTPGAKVFIVSGSDRRELPTLPISVDIDTTKQWALVASKAGYSDYNQPISFDDGQAEKAFTVMLEPKGAVAAPPWTPPAYTPPSPVVHTAPPAAPEKPAPAPAPEKPAPAPPSDNGGGGQAFLNINSIPASSVILDGKPIGQTPKLKFAVSPGSHSVLFVNADQGFKKQISVNVAAGETKAAIGKN